MVRETRRPRGRRCSRGSHGAASAAGRPKERVGAMTRVLGMAVVVGSMLAHVPAAAAPVAAAIVDGGSSRNVRTVDVAECKARFTFEGRTVVGCTTLGSPGNVPWCELANPPADPFSPAWAFCRVTGGNSRRPRTGRAAGTTPGRTTASGRPASRDDRSRNPGGADVGGAGRPSEADNGRESPFREARDGEDGEDGSDDEDASGDNGEDGADGSDDEGDFEDGEEGADDDGSEEDFDADPDNGGGEDDPDADPDNGGGEDDPDAVPDDGSDAGNEDGGVDPTGGNADGSDPGATPAPTELPPSPSPGPTETEPLPTPTGVSPPGSPGAPADGNNTGGDGGSGAPQDSSPTAGLSTAAIVGIAVGAAAAAALLLIAPVYLRRKKSAPGRAVAGAEAAKRASEEEEKEYGSAAPARAPRPVPLAVDNVRSTFASTYRSSPSSEPRSNRSSVSSRTTSQYGPDPSTISVSEAPLGRWIVATNYVPSLSDELIVEPGDIVDVYKRFDDGWVTAVNVSKGFARGVMPMHCLDLDQGQPSPDLIDEQGTDMFQ